jgi:hypothetical protein
VQVWQYVAGDRPSLSRQEFYTAMKLVSLAQLNGGQLDDQQALRLVNGLTGPVPLPRMAGMAIPRGIELPAHLLPQEPGAPGAAPASPAPSAAPARAVPPASPPPPSAAFPPLSGEQAAAFQTAFSQLDTDGDGYVQVGEAAPMNSQQGSARSVAWLLSLRPELAQAPAAAFAVLPLVHAGPPAHHRDPAPCSPCRAQTASAPSCRAGCPRPA